MERGNMIITTPVGGGGGAPIFSFYSKKIRRKRLRLVPSGKGKSPTFYGKKKGGRKVITFFCGMKRRKNGPKPTLSRCRKEKEVAPPSPAGKRGENPFLS